MVLSLPLSPTSVDKFYAQCDPEKENLCLYGYADKAWEVNLPAEEVPPEIPEPALGINFARDGMQVIPRSGQLLCLLECMRCSSILREPHLIALADSNRAVQKSDWLQLVAMHSDTWLISVAFFNGSRLDAQQRYGS